MPVCNAGYNTDDTGNYFCVTNRCIVIAKNAESVGRAGWYRQKNGKKKYYRDGQYVTGQQKIGKYVYMFSKYGNMIKRDITIHKVRYYIASNGHILAWKKVANIIQPRENV